MTSRRLSAALVGAALLGFAAPAVAQDRDAWLKSAELGPYVPATEDWAAIEAAAEKEPPLLVYMSTSRVEAIVELFKAKYPNLKVEALYNRQPELIERVTREHAAGLAEIGIIEFGGPQTARLLVPESFVTYIPAESADLYPEQYREPLQYASYYYGWGYNPKHSPDGAPFKSIWDLTTEEFRGRIILEDPLRSGDAQQSLTNIVARADELAADYEAHFGKPLELTEADAGFEWLKRVLANEPIVVGAWREVAEILDSSDKAMVGGLNFARMSDVRAGTFSMAFAENITPVDAIQVNRWVSISTFTQSPNAAKLFVRELLDGPVAAPIFENGFSSPRTGWSTSIDWMAHIADITFWPIDVDYMEQRGHEVID